MFAQMCGFKTSPLLNAQVFTYSTNILLLNIRVLTLRK